MHQIKLQLTDQLYEEAKRRAGSAGFKSVNEFVADVLADELTQETEDFDHLFTPERIAHVDKVAASVEAGGPTYSIEEVSAYLATKRADWLRSHGK
jgi:hypothetical protein